MPTSSQSQILSVVDYQLLQEQQQQQTTGQNAPAKPPVRISVNQTSVSESKRHYPKDDRRSSTEDDHFASRSHTADRRRSSDKTNDSKI